MKLNGAFRLFFVDGVNLFEANVNSVKGNTDAPQAREGRVGVEAHREDDYLRVDVSPPESSSQS
jgi:hypothetical protein